MMKRLFLYMVLCYATCLCAQNNDVVTKTDGTSLTGEVITITENEVQFRKDSTSAVYVFNKDNIHSIEFKEGYVETYNKLKGNRKASQSILKKGYHGYASLAGGGYISSNLSWGGWGGGLVSLQTIHGYQFNPYVYLGGGTGLDFVIAYNHWGEVGVCVPLFADLRLSVPSHSAAPFLDLKLGGYAPLSKVYIWGDESRPVSYGGFYFSPSVGALFSVTEKYSVGCALEYFFTTGKRNSKSEIWNFLNVRLIFGF